jgi:hypothetical protein
MFFDNQREDRLAVGNVSLRRDTIFSGSLQDFPVGSNSSNEVWILNNSSLVASSRSIRRLIICCGLVERDTAPPGYAFRARKSVR